MPVSAGRYNLLVASSVVVVAALIICFIFYQSFETKTAQYQVLNTKLNKESKRFSRLDNLSLVAAEYKKQFNRYMPVKQYETENRLYWLDELEKIRIKQKIPQLRYEISTRRPYKYDDGVIADKGLKVFVSDIKLNLSLLHEADLMRALRSIKNIKKSIHVISSCEVRRLNSGSAIRTSVPNVEARCNVKWFTFKVG